MNKKQKQEKDAGAQLLLNIRYQQHHSWQGSVQRLDTGETINFRSALELMALIEDTIGRQHHQEEDQFRSWRSGKKSKEVGLPATCDSLPG